MAYYSTQSVTDSSPVSPAFAGIQWDPLEKLRLSEPEQATLRAAEDNPLEYTLADRAEATAYAQVLFKVLREACGRGGPSSRVSLVTDKLPDDEALQMLYTDSMGVVMHYAITKFLEIVHCLMEKTDKSSVSIATTFYSNDGSLSEDWRTLLRILHLGGTGDIFAQRGAALILSLVLVVGCPSQQTAVMGSRSNVDSVQEPLQALVSWIASQLQSSAPSSLELVTPALTVLVSCSEARAIFHYSGGIGYLSRHLRRKKESSLLPRKKGGHPSVQQLYELSFCLWTLTYELNSSPSVRTSFARDGAIPALVDLVNAAPREKVVRVALAALRNLGTCTAGASPDVAGKKAIDDSVFLTEMIGCGLIKYIDHMNGRQWTDPDIVEDLNLLHRLLRENYREMTRWEIYKAEVESGQLHWGIVHTEKFFKEHAKSLEGPDGDFAVLRALIKLVASEDEEVVAIACYDIGEFVRHYPNGRSIARRLGAKDLVMSMIEHENAEIRRHALQCISKIMVQKWKASQKKGLAIFHRH